MRIVLDCRGADYASVTGLECLKFAYLNGPGAWTPEQLDEQTRRGELLGAIDVLGDSPQKASILDWTALTPKDPDRLAWWVKARSELASDAVVLCIRDALPAVIGVLAGTIAYYRVLVTDLSTSGEPPLMVPQYGLPPNVRLLGCQYVQEPLSGGAYSLSILFDDTWQHDKMVPGAAAALHATAAPAAPVIAPVEAAAADFGPPGPSGSGTADLAAFQAAALDPPLSSAGGTTWSGPLSAPPPGPPPTDTPTSPDAGTGASSSPDAAAAAADTGDDQPNNNGVVSHETFAVRPFVQTHIEATEGHPILNRLGTPIAPTSAPPAVVGPPINHGYVAAWIDDGHKIAQAFRSARAGRAAGYLEDALAQLLEVGQLLSELGR